MAAGGPGRTDSTLGRPHSHYIDAIVIPVPRASLDTYKLMSAEWGNAHLRTALCITPIQSATTLSPVN